MKKVISAVLSVLLVFSFSVTVSAEDNAVPSVSAQSYVLYCADNGKIICSKDENKQMKPASTTKLMTSLIALEEAASGNKKVKFTDEMIAEGSSMYLKVGEVVTLKDLASGMMMASGNDAANATAISISGSTEKFAAKMNERAQQIGMKNTHFVTPSGLDDEEHYSTAYDLAVLMSYALENEDFAQLTSQKSATVNFIEPSSKKTTYSNHNKLLSLYEYCIGGKTGYTMAAGRCLVSASKKDGLTLICVTLNDKNDWNDHISLYDYGFSQYSCYSSADTEFFADIPCVGGESDTVTVTGEKNASIVIPSEDKDRVSRKVYIDSFVYAPIKKNEAVGRIEYLIDDKVISVVDLIAVDKVNSKKEIKNIFTKIKDLFTYG
ncbi:MAG: D-alanyl-D-alanine carboxypeptidase family protein [Ruminococcus sp.]|nr:D-alanyl-D-alanine carboxypeptidase family protein [Ruminococcus sp.]